MLDTEGIFCRVKELPLLGDPKVPGGRLEALRKALVPSLVRAYSAEQPIMVGWMRKSPEDSIDVVLGGFLNGQDEDAATHPLYPPGAAATIIKGNEFSDILQSFPYWLRCVGQPDSFTVPKEDARPGEVAANFEDNITHLVRTPFAWLIAAEPVSQSAFNEELTELHQHLTYLLDRQNVSGRDRVELERTQERYKELSRSAISGFWNVHVFAGGASEETAWQTAALFCSASDLERLPYSLRPVREIRPFHEIVLDRITDPSHVDTPTLAPKSPFLGSSELVAAIARPPYREIPGVRLFETPEFDVTPEATSGDILLGTVLDRAGQPAGQLGVTTSTLNRHAFVCGATGGGKSQTVRHLLEGLYKANIPWMVVEPAKAEYARMAGRLADYGGEVSVIRPGQIDAIPVSLNPLQPEYGIPLQTHIDLVRQLFLAAFETHEPLPQVLAKALNRCYTDLGWDLTLSASRYPLITPRYPTLGDLQRVAQSVVEDIGYGKEVTGDVRGFIDVRISSLRLGTSGQFFEGGHPMDMEDLLSRNVVLELEDLANDQDQAFFIGALLIRLVEYLRVRNEERWKKAQENSESAAHEQVHGLRHVTVVEEAHRLLKSTEKESPAAQAVNMFANMLAEVRAYGEGIIVAEQIPSKIANEVIKNTALKVVHRLPAKDDRESVGATMNLDDDQSRHVVTLSPGKAAVFTDGMDHPVLVRVPYGEDRERTLASPPSVSVCATRSSSCGPQCHDRPCTLREIAEAKRLAEDPRLTLWIELAIAAHVCGEPEPAPDESWLADLRGRATTRQLDCAIAYRAMEGVNSRYDGLIEHYSPERLAAHVAERARERLVGAGTPCDGSEVWWQGGRFRWVHVFRALDDDSDRSEPHPLTQQWREQGLELPFSSQDEQLKVLSDHPSKIAPKVAVLGSNDPPVYEVAAEKLVVAENPMESLSKAIGFLNTPTDWPECRLYSELWREKHNDNNDD